MPALNFALSAVAVTVAALSPSLYAQSTSWVRDSAPGVPPARAGHALCTDTLHDDVVLFGGQGAGLLGDTWRLHAGAWQQVAIGAGPTARTGHAMAYDAARQRVVLFGGDDGALNGDTWWWDGTTWSLLPIGGPSARTGHAMAYDAARQRIVLFGGRAAPGTALADTWEFDGFSWTQVITVGGPVAREGHAMAFADGQVLLYGGQSPGLGLVADTWRWSGTVWQPVVTASFPSARREHAMARDGAGRVVVYGGFDSVQRGDTWRFDGVDWTQLAPVGAPPSPRSAAAMADGEFGGPTLFGGENGGLLRDTWSLSDAAMPYGQGCGSPAMGFVPDPAAPPQLGQLASATITNAPTPVAGVMMGWSRDLFGPFPLPLSLTGFGMTGCELLQSAEIVGLGASVLTSTSLSFQFPIPNAPHLIGVEVFVQAYGYAPGANPAQLIVSNAIDWAIATPLAGPFSIVEPFDSSLQFDAARSGGMWFGGTGVFGKIGGDGRHGEFDLALATATGTQVNGRDLYVVDCDHTVIPADNTTDGLEAIVTDGRFFFSTMTVPADAHVRFVGGSPAVLNVVGRLAVDGVLDVAGESHAAVPGGTSQVGQPGAAAGAFGGRGGDGGDKCLGIGASASYSGQDGEDCRVPAGHAYASSTVGTGGEGSALFPASGLNADIMFALNPVPITPLSYALSTVAGGGGGGGGWTAGGGGAVDAVLQGSVTLPNQASFMGPMTTPSAQPAVFPLPVGARSSLHFLISGAGGGGAASNTTMALNLVRQWAPGSGGGGGGGAMALRAGTQLLLDSGGALLANGGSAADRIGAAAGPQPAPGGGGAGGAIVLQCDGVTSLPGLIDVRGGSGGLLSVIGGGGLPPGGGQVNAHGGDGGDGFLHFERSLPPTLFDLPQVQPSVSLQHLRPLVELDPLVAMQSTWYQTGSDRPVDYRRYELVALVNGVTTTLSDDPAAAPMAATVGAPVRARFQAARLDLVTGEVLEVGPWREFVGNRPGRIGIAAEGFNAFRFQLVLDRAVATQVAIDEVRVIYGQ